MLMLAFQRSSSNAFSRLRRILSPCNLCKTFLPLCMRVPSYQSFLLSGFSLIENQCTRYLYECSVELRASIVQVIPIRLPFASLVQRCFEQPLKRRHYTTCNPPGSTFYLHPETALRRTAPHHGKVLQLITNA